MHVVYELSGRISRSDLCASRVLYSRMLFNWRFLQYVNVHSVIKQRLCHFSRVVLERFQPPFSGSALEISVCSVQRHLISKPAQRKWCKGASVSLLNFWSLVCTLSYNGGQFTIGCDSGPCNAMFKTLRAIPTQLTRAYGQQGHVSGLSLGWCRASSIIKGRWENMGKVLQLEMVIIGVSLGKTLFLTFKESAGFCYQAAGYL